MRKILLVFSFLLVNVYTFSQSISKYIVVDQFGYRPDDKKVAVIRDPQTGFDAAESFTPGENYALVDASNDEVVFEGSPVVWNNGIEDTTSGDKAWWFDFSTISDEGSYYVMDQDKNVKSYTFDIKSDVYDDVLKHAVRTFFYQRVGYAKEAPYAETGWTDGASHIGALQDKNCRPYNDLNNAAKERDLSGGWYDAGDFNKYSIWTANYVYEMLQAYEENPYAWTDDYNLPQSGNGIPDLIDEAKWGMDHLLKLQNSDGSVIAIVSLDHASPPSAATGRSKYGSVNTSSALAAASAYAYGAKVFTKFEQYAYADQLKTAAINAYKWAEQNPNVIWKNNDAASGTSGVGAGQQEVDNYGRLGYKMRASAHLFEITKDVAYKTFFEANISEMHLLQWYYAYPYETREQDAVLYYSKLDGISSSVKNTIRSRYTHSIGQSDDNLKAFDQSKDPFKAWIGSYTWGSNNTKSNQGNMLYAAVLYNTNVSRNEDLKTSAQDYIHYIHGVNPLSICYLSNMYGKGAENCVNEFYHTWFFDKNPKWDRVGTSTYGPAPGFLVGGPNSSYKLDGCCTGSCSSNQLCNLNAVTPPFGQPRQKSYLDFNSNWPANSWEVTENSCGYQLAYIRLLSKFVDRSDAVVLPTSTVDLANEKSLATIYPNPFTVGFEIKNIKTGQYFIHDLRGALLETGQLSENNIIGTSLNSGVYTVTVQSLGTSSHFKIVKR